MMDDVFGPDGPPPESAATVPYNVEAEQALLGNLLYDNRTFEQVEDLLQPQFFYLEAHQAIFTAIQRLRESQQLADPTTLKSFFDSDEKLKGVGGARYLRDLAENIVSLANTRDYALRIRDLYLRRELMGVFDTARHDAATPSVDQDAIKIIERTEQDLFGLATFGESEKSAVALAKAMTEAIKTAQAAFDRQSEVTGVTTGFRDLDRKLGGLHGSDLIILAGRPSMGKTALATNIALNAARAFHRTNGLDGAPTVFFSLEMSAEQLGNRILADLASIASDRMRRGDLEPDDFPKFAAALRDMQKVPLFIDDTASLSISALRTRARRLKRSHDIGLIIVDYLQLMSGSSSRSSENRVLEISEITRGMKILAKDLDVPVIALSQLSRKVEDREDKRPQLADLRESGSIEQDADVVMFVYRDEYYMERAEPKRRDNETQEKFEERYEIWQQTFSDVKNTAEVILAKQRHGPIGPVRMYFDGTFTRFGNLDEVHDPR